ncbi:FAD-dependent oxidoreductase [Paraburkholderia tagetis]|uniref:FAD-dependent monooxygenase n=1 Tax=Paraburkholderia tagetis TaxID=2913261 RepID=A0A9X1RMJ3_9BURK|nr:FAD-dependent monooxygenase [Paraburkholderia tagetis]MCG5073250.1 FAD-dependent monooxygenase [Paraburkholderia tagetis]
MRQIRVPVFVVGAGPAGLTTAALLAKYGVEVLAITRYPGTAHSPRAHITNQRTVEVFRDLGIEDRVRALATSNELMGNNVWATSFAGKEIARLETWGTGVKRKADYEAASPSQMCNAPQHLLEPVILTAAREYGARFLFNTELVSMTQTDDAVHSKVVDRLTGEEFEIVSDYAVGADGAQSVVAKQLGFEYEGEMGLGCAVNCWLEVDLEKYTAHRPGVLYWMCQPGSDYWVGSGTWINVRPWNEWVLLFMYNPKDGEPDLSEEAVIARARATIGDPDIPIRVKAVSRWTINRMFAQTMVKGRVAIAGDAAHRHPPANGLGSNTSVQDGFNLAWKLAMIVKGQASPALLQTYSDERQPVAQGVVNRAIKSVAGMLPIAQALGFQEGQSAADGWASLDELFAGSEAGKRRRKTLAEAIDLQNYQFNCHGVELGQRYASSAVVADGAVFPEPTRDPELYYHPTTTPGACLPHAWIQRDDQLVSTLDLVGQGAFTVLTGPGGEAWSEAAQRVGDEFGVTVNAVSIAHGTGTFDAYGQWAAQREMEDDGCVLVRPDRFVAYRSTSLAADPLAELRRALSAILGRSPRTDDRAKLDAAGVSA